MMNVKTPYPSYCKVLECKPCAELFHIAPLTKCEHKAKVHPELWYPHVTREVLIKAHRGESYNDLLFDGVPNPFKPKGGSNLQQSNDGSVATKPVQENPEPVVDEVMPEVPSNSLPAPKSSKKAKGRKRKPDESASLVDVTKLVGDIAACTATRNDFMRCITMCGVSLTPENLQELKSCTHWADV